jgi:hypothetical protein
MPTIAHTFFVRPDAQLQQDTRLHLAERRFEDTLIVSRTLVRPRAPLSQTTAHRSEQPRPLPKQ